ncbi:major cardiolipin synthase ClsA [Paenibacillus baekrokdamisoli]|uniref:Cardiolipin synthase n=1 Tax=Paenibacillus baekrokdamisoli TaxID=1712516 RepID=A0A3G9JD89_9BACL|nr:cardiolipin synthase [Paenibacillus baekrokdamisoli]MBB3068019.1 cardiolipin synthase [Paenibacillus baekrokdamisoli]BBH22933.1 major cardiolipin synthase ClsA [Paenibacillus baekrokdamisoli]
MTSQFYTNLYEIITILNIPLAIAVIFMERRNVGVTWAWLMVLLFLPVVGFGFYLIFGQNMSKKKLYKISKRTLSTMNDLIETQRKEFREHQIVYHDPAMENYQDLIYMNLTSGFALYSQNNAIDIFTNGNDKFDALIRDIEAATHHIHLMYYIVQPDGLGNRLVDLLTKKASEGVKVRFLYDDIGSSHLPRHFFDRLRNAGGEVAAFFPSKIPYLNIRVNYRNHRKLAIMDGTIGYIGGINIGDEYLGLNKRFGYWRDSHLRIQGYAVQQMQAHFMMDWNLASSAAIDRNMEELFPESVDCGLAGIQIVSSGPDRAMEQIKNAYIKMINAAKESIYIQTPYFIPDESMLNALKMAALSGVDVRIMLPSRPDHQMVFWASHSYLGELLAEGIRCYQYDKGFLHAKMIVVDGKVASIGTANFDIRSFKLNFEINAMIFDSGTAQTLKRVFEDDIEDSFELTYDAYMSRPLLQRFKESCTRLLSPIL